MRLILSSDREPFGEHVRQAGLDDFLLRGRDVVFYTPLLDAVVLDVINAIGRAPISVARLADAADVNEIFFARLDAQLFDSHPMDAVIANESHGHMGVTEKANGGVLISEARGGVEIVEDVPHC